MFDYAGYPVNPTEVISKANKGFIINPLAVVVNDPEFPIAWLLRPGRDIINIDLMEPGYN